MNKQEIINRVKEKTLIGMCDIFIEGFMATSDAKFKVSGSQDDVANRFKTGYDLLKQACHKLDDLLDDD
jgi:hypothetical protein